MEEEESSSEYNSSESSSESDGETIQDIPDKEFFKTLSCLKNKDPKIYDSSVKFFSDAPVILKGKKQPSSSKQSLLSDQNNSDHQSKDTETKHVPQSAKFSLRDFDSDSNSEDELMVFKKPNNEEQHQTQPENEYIDFLKGRKIALDDKEIEGDLKPLHNYWNNQQLDENEQFLKDYILNKKYLRNENVSTVLNEDLSEDERELEEQAQYEANYNFRFENDENLKIKRFPRTIEGSLRRKNDSRSKKRAEIAQRKKEEKEQKRKEIKKKQKEKLSEIEQRLNMLKELTGNKELGFKDEEIMEDFDPEKHDQKMKEFFNDEYYGKEDTEHPVFSEEDNFWENKDTNMYCDEEKEKKLTRTQRKKLRKKKTYKDVMDIAKPSFDPGVHSDFKKYVDEYYSLDCEDFIDDIPCKFKYREVVPNDYGLSIEEILMADDNELNRWAPVSKICKRRPEHVERNEIKIYKNKAQDEYLKKKILQSLYIDPEEVKEKKEGNDNSEDMEISPSNHSHLEENDKHEASGNGNDCNQSNTSKHGKKKKKKNFPAQKDDQVKENDINENEGNKGLVGGDTIQDKINGHNETNNSKKKRNKKKKHRKSNQLNILQSNNVQQESKINQNASHVQNKFKNKEDGKVEFKPKLKKKLKSFKTKNSILNLSDSRLQAYGIKPKLFRSKIMYSQRTPT